MRVALTGADGFTGRYVIDELARRGAECVSISADLTDAAALDAAIADAQFDRLLHLAAIAFAGGDDWESFYTVNQIGSFNLLASVARHHPGSVCLLASSAQIYGPAAEGLVREDAPPNPANHYALSKYAMELGAQMWRDTLDIRIARPFNYTGVGQEARYLVPKIVDHFSRRESVIELGNTQVLRDFGDVRAVVSAYCELLEAPDSFAPVNIATGRLSSIGEIMAILEKLTGHSMEIRVNPAFLRAGDVPVLGGDAAMLRSLAPGWSPLPLEDTLRWMLEAAPQA